MHKVRVHEEEQLDSLAFQANTGLMDQIMENEGSEGLNRWWHTQSRKTRGDASLLVALAEHLIECNDHETAQAIIVKGLKNQKNEPLLLLIPR